MLDLQTLEFRNFGSFGNNLTTVRFSDGLNLITGENGNGKSTILEPLTYVLYGKPFREGKIEDIFNWTNANPEVSIEFEKDGHHYRIWRTDKKETLEIDKAEISGFTSKGGFQREVEKIIGISYDLWRRIVLVSADAHKPFLKMKKAELRKTLEAYFSLGTITSMLKVVKNQISELKSDIRLYNERHESAIKAHQTEIERMVDVRDRRDQAKNMLDSVNTQVSDSTLELNNMLVSKYEEFSKYESDTNFEITKLKSDAESFEEIQKQKIGILLMDMEQLNERIDDDIEVSNQKNNSVKDKIQEILDAKSIEEAEFEHNKAEKISIDTETLRSRIQDANEKNQEIPNMESAIVKLKNTTGDISNSDLSDIRGKMAVLQSDAKKGSELRDFIVNNDTCPMCKSVMTKQHKETEIQRLTDERLKLKTEMDTLRKIESEYTAKIEEQNVKSAELNKLINELSEAKSRVSLDFEMISRLTQSLEELKNSKFDSNPFELQISNLKNSLIDIDSIPSKYDSKKGEISTEIAKIKGQSADTKKIEELKQSILIKKSELETLITDVTGKIAFEQARIVTAQEALDVQEALIKEQESCISKKKLDVSNALKTLEERERDLDKRRLMEKVLGDGGVKEYLISKIVPILNQKVNSNLRIFDLPLHIEFKNDLSVDFRNFRAGKKKGKYSQHSKGERKRIDFAILLSFTEVVQTMLNWYSSVMFFDEFLDEGMDSRGIDTLLECLQKRVNAQKGSGIYIVSHKVTTDYFSERWLVEKDEDGFSSITIKR